MVILISISAKNKQDILVCDRSFGNLLNLTSRKDMIYIIVILGPFSDV